ncbi:hypothetical protein FGG78_43820, partial [Thioclava sp. BHET1]
MNGLHEVETGAGAPPVPERNRGTALQPDWFEAVQANLSAAERRAAGYGTRRSVKKDYQAAWLVQAIRCIDLTT